MKTQIRKMKQVLDAPKVMEVPEVQGRRVPAMISGNKILRDQDFRPMDLVDYFTARVITTLDGCTDSGVIAVVQDSSMPNVRVRARIKTIR